MQRYFDVVQAPSGDAIVGGLVSVFIGGTTTLATLYVDNGVTLSPNPVTTNTDGEYAFYAANGTYTLQITATNYATEVKPGVVMFDPSDNVSFGNNVTLVAGTANGVLYLNGSKVVTSGSMLVFDGVNLGLGVTPSAWGSNQRAIQLISNSRSHLVTFANAISVGANYYADNSSFYYTITGQNATRFDQNSGAFSWHTAPSGTAGNVISFTQAMTLDASGNLGVGTSSPTNKLQVVSAGTTLAQFTGAEYSQIRHSDGTRTLYTQVYNNLALFATESNTPLAFGTNNAEKMRLDASGNLIQTAPTTPPTLSTNGTMVFNLTSNTNLRVSVRGSDGTTRTANFTLV